MSHLTIALRALPSSWGVHLPVHCLPVVWYTVYGLRVEAEGVTKYKRGHIDVCDGSRFSQDWPHFNALGPATDGRLTSDSVCNPTEPLTAVERLSSRSMLWAGLVRAR